MEPEKQLHPLSIDERAYRFFPTSKQEKTSFNKDGTRFYFYGQIEHDDYQKLMLEEFYKYLQTNKLQVKDEYWNDQKILKFLSGRGFKNKEAYQAIQLHNQFRTQYLGINNDRVLFDPVADIIKSGFIYPCGRDKNFRPVFVFNVKKVDLKNPQSSFKAAVLVQEEIVKNFLLPGQVENWDCIYDLGQMGITQIPVGILKEMLQKMSLNYGGRLYRMWIVNAPMTVSFSWKVVSAFLDQVTVDKIKISKKNTQKDIFTLCDPSQIQKKYGGKQENRKQYWPLQVPQGVFDEKRLISEEEYEDRLKKGQLSRNFINPKYR